MLKRKRFSRLSSRDSFFFLVCGISAALSLLSTSTLPQSASLPQPLLNSATFEVQEDLGFTVDAPLSLHVKSGP